MTLEDANLYMTFAQKLLWLAITLAGGLSYYLFRRGQYRRSVKRQYELVKKLRVWLGETASFLRGNGGRNSLPDFRISETAAKELRDATKNHVSQKEHEILDYYWRDSALINNQLDSVQKLGAAIPVAQLEKLPGYFAASTLSGNFISFQNGPLPGVAPQELAVQLDNIAGVMKIHEKNLSEIL